MATVEVTEVPPVEPEKVFTLTLTEREAEYVATALGSVDNRTDVFVFHQLSEAGARWGSNSDPDHTSKFFDTKRGEGYFQIREKD